MLHELRDDPFFVGVAANDLGLLFRKCGFATGDRDVSFYDYAVELRRRTGDRVELRRVLSNLGAALVVDLELSRADPVLAEALALAVEQKDASAEWKVRLNDAMRLALRCTEFPQRRLPPRVPASRDASIPGCVRGEDGSFGIGSELEGQIRTQLGAAAEAGRRAGVTTQTLCASFTPPGQFLCAWIPAVP